MSIEIVRNTNPQKRIYAISEFKEGRAYENIETGDVVLQTNAMTYPILLSDPIFVGVGPGYFDEDSFFEVNLKIEVTVK